MNTRPLLEVRDLEVRFPSDAGTVHAVNGISFDVREGERLGIVGESGSGKSVTALSVMGLVPTPPATIEGGIVFDGVDLMRAGAAERRLARGAGIALVFQNPLNCLNPAMKIGDQIVEAIRAHRDMTKRAAREEAIALLARVELPSPPKNAEEYPHRFSGGMRQRVMIAMALAAEPRIVIADEPTTALDVTIQAQIIELLASVSSERGASVVLITHDLGLLAGFADRILVMYAGRIVEQASVDTIYEGATHPYTWGLMTSTTRLDKERRETLVPIPGNPPSAITVPPGCAFHPRCRYAQGVCRTELPRLEVHPGDAHPSACHFAGQLTPPAEVEAMLA
jgi:oligopeptide/dipeptide ABC transporter ATP-binding protein